MHSRSYAATLRAAHGRDPDRGAASSSTRCCARSPEFAALWERHEVARRAPNTRKRIAAPGGRR